MVLGVVGLATLKIANALFPPKTKGLSPYKQQKQSAALRRIEEIEAMPAFGSTGLSLPAHVFQEYKDLQALSGSLCRESQELT